MSVNGHKNQLVCLAQQDNSKEQIRKKDGNLDDDFGLYNMCN